MIKNRNIVIIEDNETFSLLVTHYLKNNLANANVFIENSGKKAIESIKRLNPAIVVLDYYLEDDLSAKDVMVVINQLPSPPRVIMLSSMTDEREKEEIMKMGVRQFIPKSNESIYDLVRVIQDHLSEMEQEDSVRSNDGGLSLQVKIAIGGIVLLALAAVLFLLVS